MGISCVNLAICIQLDIQMIYFVTAFVRGVAAAKEVVVRGRRARPGGPAAALLDAERYAWRGGRERTGEIDLNL